MRWATGHIDALRRGETVKFRPHGNSMTGRIESGQLCTVAPVTPNEVRVGDAVLCIVGPYQYLHLVKAIDSQGRFQIGNNEGRINGWTTKVFGKLLKVEP